MTQSRMTGPVLTGRRLAGTLLAGLLILILAQTATPSWAAADAPPAAPAPAAATPMAGEAAAPPAAAEKPAGPTEVKVGMYVTQLLDFDMSKRSFYASFWMWYLQDNPDYDPHATVEVVNAKSDSVKFAALDTSKGIRWQQEKHNTVLAEDWEIAHFPFDRQKLVIAIEDGQSDTGRIRFVADSKNSRIDPAATVPGWTIEGFELTAQDVTYNTSYGDPTLSEDSVYSRVVATITVKRQGVRLLCSLFVGFGVAFLLALLTFFLDFESMAGSRIGLCAAAVFAAVGNKYALDGYLPPASTFTLADVIVSTTFVAILLAALAVVLMQLTHKRCPRFARAANLLLGLAALAGYIGTNGYAIASAV
ncbi:hypothetical protein AZL_b00370 (plasmid) [Azospirillum sp. B510]|uniref:hypothetical protein n=1 Tax=Azospirillum sp. (strain B510) TaxID=137722 RepID=UPI0001C4C9B2|nr:hypothetical protein [Azospirillum sp. B510]BAI74700.1 hypothetical protein AZL_b00370 [Azospirillum sp. B510]